MGNNNPPPPKKKNSFRLFMYLREADIKGLVHGFIFNIDDNICSKTNTYKRDKRLNKSTIEEVLLLLNSDLI